MLGDEPRWEHLSSLHPPSRMDRSQHSGTARVNHGQQMSSCLGWADVFSGYPFFPPSSVCLLSDFIMQCHRQSRPSGFISRLIIAVPLVTDCKQGCNRFTCCTTVIGSYTIYGVKSIHMELNLWGRWLIHRLGITFVRFRAKGSEFTVHNVTAFITLHLKCETNELESLIWLIS